MCLTAAASSSTKEKFMSNAKATPSVSQVPFVKSIVQQLDVLSTRRQEWEATDYKKANEGLYKMLGDTLAVYDTHFVKGNEKEQKELRASLIQRLKADGIRVVKTSTTLTMLARFVFNADRKRAQGYAYVLTAAVSHKVQSVDFPAWVVKQGGLEEIKRLMVKKPEAIAKLAAVQKATVAVKGDVELNKLQPLASVKLEGIKGNFAVLLAKPNVNGGVDIVGSLSEVNDALVNALILRMAKAQVEAAVADKALSDQTKRENDDLLAVRQTQLRKVVNG
jgi:hypothetical protein